MNTTGALWAQTPGGLIVPMPVMPVPMPYERYATPEFLRFMDALQKHLPEVQEGVAKSLAAAPAQTKRNEFEEIAGVWEGIRERRIDRGLSDETLRTMALRCAPVAAIINTRAARAANFCHLPESETDVGIRVELRDPDRRPTKEEKDEMRQLEDIILECQLPDVEGLPSGLTLEQLVKLLVRDSLTLDFAALEIIPGANRERFPAVAWRPVDAAEIRLTEPEEYHPKRAGVKNVVAVQMQRGEVVAEYTQDEIGWIVRNPSTAQSRRGYGTSELEHAISIVSGILLGNEYNVQQFISSSVPPGILSISGNLHPRTLEGFRRQWQAMLQGIPGQHLMPIIGVEEGQGVNFIRFRDSNRDMEFHQFLAFLITVLCSLYLIHPEEIGMQSWAPQSATLNQPSPQARIEASTDRGLKPLMRCLMDLINRHILWKIDRNRKYIARWKNIDPADEERELRLRQMRLQMGITLPKHEIAEMDREPHPYDDVPLHPNMFQVYMQKMMELQPEPEPGEEGIPGYRAGEKREEGEQEQEAAERMRALEALAGGGEEEGGPQRRQGPPPFGKSLRRVIEVEIDE